MSLFLREKRDGRRAPGYLLYLLAGGTVVAAILFLHGRSASPAAAPSRRRGRAASVGAITQPAALMSPVNVAEKSGETAPARSFRLTPPRSAALPPGAPAGPAPSGAFDAIDAALSAAPALPADSPAASDSPYAALPPAFAASGRPAASGESKVERGQMLLGYRDQSADAAETEAKPSAPAAADPAGHAIAPRGSLIHVILLTTVDTSNPSAIIQLGIARSLIFHRRILLPFGTRLLGRLSGHPLRDRLNLTAETVLFPDGRELPIAATAVEADETGASLRPGISAHFFPPPPWAQLAPYVSDFFTGFMGLLESRAQTQFAVGVGGLSLQSSNPSTVRAPLAQASSSAIQDFTQSRLKEIEERYASYYLVPAGTDFWLQLENDLALGPLHANRAVE